MGRRGHSPRTTAVGSLRRKYSLETGGLLARPLDLPGVQLGERGAAIFGFFVAIRHATRHAAIASASAECAPSRRTS
jgi:hypothetical protein